MAIQIVSSASNTATSFSIKLPATTAGDIFDSQTGPPFRSGDLINFIASDEY